MKIKYILPDEPKKLVINIRENLTLKPQRFYDDFSYKTTYLKYN